MDPQLTHLPPVLPIDELEPGHSGKRPILPELLHMLPQVEHQVKTLPRAIMTLAVTCDWNVWPVFSLKCLQMKGALREG